MHIGMVTQVKQPGQVWRCDSMPEGRALYLSPELPYLYVRADGTTDPFDFAIEQRKYNKDTSWTLIGDADSIASVVALLA